MSKLYRFGFETNFAPSGVTPLKWARAANGRLGGMSSSMSASALTLAVPAGTTKIRGRLFAKWSSTGQTNLVTVGNIIISVLSGNLLIGPSGSQVNMGAHGIAANTGWEMLEFTFDLAASAAGAVWARLGAASGTRNGSTTASVSQFTLGGNGLVSFDDVAVNDGVDDLSGGDGNSGVPPAIRCKAAVMGDAAAGNAWSVTSPATLRRQTATSASHVVFHTAVGRVLATRVTIYGDLFVEVYDMSLNHLGTIGTGANVGVGAVMNQTLARLYPVGNLCLVGISNVSPHTVAVVDPVALSTVATSVTLANFSGEGAPAGLTAAPRKETPVVQIGGSQVFVDGGQASGRAIIHALGADGAFRGLSAAATGFTRDIFVANGKGYRVATDATIREFTVAENVAPVLSGVTITLPALPATGARVAVAGTNAYIPLANNSCAVLDLAANPPTVASTFALGNWSAINDVVTDGTRLFLLGAMTGFGNSVYAYNLADGSVAWSDNTLATRSNIFGLRVCAAKLVAATHTAKALRVYDPASGTFSDIGGPGLPYDLFCNMATAGGDCARIAVGDTIINTTTGAQVGLDDFAAALTQQSSNSNFIPEVSGAPNTNLVAGVTTPALDFTPVAYEGHNISIASYRRDDEGAHTADFGVEDAGGYRQAGVVSFPTMDYPASKQASQFFKAGTTPWTIEEAQALKFKLRANA